MSFRDIGNVLRTVGDVTTAVSPIVTGVRGLSGSRPPSSGRATEAFFPTSLRSLTGPVGLDIGPKSSFTGGVPGLNVDTARSGLANLRGRFGGMRAGMPTTGDIASRRAITGNMRGRLGNLRAGLRPGFGDITQTRVQAVRNARDEAVGDLRESLNRRRVLGSSFAEDAEARVKAEFAQTEAETRADAFLQELDSNLAIEQVVADSLRLDDESFRTQMSQVAQQLQLNEAEARNFMADVELSRAQAQAEIAQAQQAVNELGLPAEILGNLARIAQNNAQFDIEQLIQDSARRGEAAAGIGEGLGALGRLFSTGSSLAGGTESGGGLLSGLTNIFDGGAGANPFTFFSAGPGASSTGSVAGGIDAAVSGALPALGSAAAPSSVTLASGAGFGAGAPAAAGTSALGAAAGIAAPIVFPFVMSSLFGAGPGTKPIPNQIQDASSFLQDIAAADDPNAIRADLIPLAEGIAFNPEARQAAMRILGPGVTEWFVRNGQKILQHKRRNRSLLNTGGNPRPDGGQ